MNKNTQKLIKILSILALTIFLLVSLYITFHIIRFIEDPIKLQNYIESFGALAPSVYIALTILQIFFPIIPGEPIELIGGYCFGTIEGTLFCLIGETIGSIIVLVFTRKFGSKLLEIFFNPNKLEKLDRLFSSEKNIKILTILFLLPGTPKDLLCYFAGLTKINIYLLITITSLARIPSVVSSAIIGGSLGSKNYLVFIITFVLTSIISIIGILFFNKKINKKTS